MSNLWVKAVNKLFTDGWVNCVRLSTVIKKGVQLFIFDSISSLFTPIILLNAQYSSTPLFAFFNLLKDSYTHNPQGLLLRQRKNI